MRTSDWKGINYRGRGAMTLVELLVVIAVLGVLVAVLIPAVQRVRETAARQACANKLGQIALAVHTFAERQGRFPYNQYGGPFKVGKNSQAWSWMVRILPDIDQGASLVEGKIDGATLATSSLTSHTIALFLCPSDPSSHVGPRYDAGNLRGLAVGQTNYKGVSGANWGDARRRGGTIKINTDWRHIGTNGSFDGHRQGDGVFYRVDYERRFRINQITDGASNTFLLGEDVPSKSAWCSWPYSNNANGTCAIPPNVRKADGQEYPPDNWENTESFRSLHIGGLQFANADASVHFIANQIDLNVYRALATIRGGETVTRP